METLSDAIEVGSRGLWDFRHHFSVFDFMRKNRSKRVSFSGYEC